MTKKAKKGFTLVELLVVIAIIGILAAVGITALSGARAKARDAKRIADIKQIGAALELYFNDKGTYPTGSGLTLGEVDGITECNGGKCLVLCSGETTTGFQPSACTGGTPITYMGLIPKDPGAAAADCAGGSTAPCRYTYTQATGGLGYRIWFSLEGASGGLSAGSVCTTQNGMKNASDDAGCP